MNDSPRKKTLEQDYCVYPNRDVRSFEARTSKASTASAIGCLERLSKFIEIQHISVDQFWGSSRTHASCQDIQNFCESVGFKINAADEMSLKTTLFKQNPTVSIYDLCSKVAPWNSNSKQMILDFFRTRPEKMSDATNRKINIMTATSIASKVNINPTATTKASQHTRPQSSHIQSFRNTLRRPQSAVALHGQGNKSREYLRIYKDREKEISNQLTVAINKAKDEHEYELLLKMGEANDLNKEMKSAINYRAYKNAQGNLKVKVFNLDVLYNQINLDEFEREFNNIKKKFNETRKISVWEMLSVHRKDKSNPPERLAKSQSKKTIKKPDRQKELIGVLTETMNLTNVLKNQLRILKAQGIHGTE